MSDSEVIKRILSYSQLYSWQKCRYLWHLYYERGIRRRYSGAPMSLGSATHEGLAAGLRNTSVDQAISEYGTKVTEQGLMEEEEKQLDEILFRAHVIVERTLKELDVGHKWETVKLDGNPLVEYRFLIPFESGVWDFFQGYIDWVARDLETGFVWIVDHKIRETFTGEASEEFNTQMATYVKLLNERTDLDIRGSALHQVKSAVPRPPKKNKTKGMSRQLILTDWETYKKECIAWGENPDDYLDMKEKLDAVEWFRFTRNYWGREIVDSIWANFVDAASEIGVLLNTPRTINFFNCNGCKLRDFCFAELRDENTDFLMKTQFKHRDEENVPLPLDFDEEEIKDAV